MTAVAGKGDEAGFDSSAKNAAAQRSPAPALSVPSFDVSRLNFAVTGGSRGLGLALGRELAARGAAFVLLIGGGGPSPLEGGEDAQETSGCELRYVNSDLATVEGVEAARGELRRHFADKALHGLANVAGVAFPRGTMDDTDVDFWDRMMAVNCRAPVFLMQEAARLMRRAGEPGAIINVTSVAGLGGAPFVFAYSAAKAALNCATKTAALELRPHRIRVNAVVMGWTLTDNEDRGQTRDAGDDWLARADAAHPMGRLLRPVDLVATLGHLLSPATAMITGTLVHVCPEHIDGTLPER